jgi:hypothetical protein
VCRSRGAADRQRIRDVGSLNGSVVTRPNAGRRSRGRGRPSRTRGPRVFPGLDGCVCQPDQSIFRLLREATEAGVPFFIEFQRIFADFCFTHRTHLFSVYPATRRRCAVDQVKWDANLLAFYTMSTAGSRRCVPSLRYVPMVLPWKIRIKVDRP